VYVAEIILIIGGARSGKSRHATKIAETMPEKRLFVATSLVTDEEMRQRIDRHRQDREKGGWDTVEEPVALADTLASYSDYQLVLIDCLTLWINNLLMNNDALDEDLVAEYARELVAACRQRSGTVIMVTNEVGLGIVPDNELARRFRDLAGRCNQIIGGGADRVDLVTCGIPLTIKGENP